MNGFKLNTKSDNIFIINLSEIEKRLDPNPYHIERLAEIEKLQKLDCKKLKSVVIPSKSKTNTIKENDIYIGLENIKSNTGEYIKTKEKESISSANVFKSGQILFPKLRPYLNKVFLAEFDGICSTEFHVFNAKNINVEYLAIYLRSSFVVNQTKHLMTGNTLPRLQTDDINNIPVPIISDEFQQQIVDLYNEAFQKKQQKENEAKDLLASIDDYLLNELGIKLPKKDNSLEKRIFTTSFSKLVNRLEPQFYDTYYEDLKTAVSNSIYNLKPLKNICDLLNGFAFKSSDYTNNTNTLNIRMSNIRPNNQFDTNYNPKFLPDSYYELYKNYRLHEGDIIVAMTDMASDPKILGVPTIVTNPNNKNLLLNQRVGKLYKINNEEVNFDYLRYVLSSSFVKDYYNQQGARGVQINISRNQILSALIPIPPKDKQIEIANHITDLRNQAKQLELVADKIMIEAKAEVENIILG